MPDQQATAADLNRRVAEHYDVLSPYYHELWGEHIHHGLYEGGDESRDQATDNLIRLVVDRCGIGARDRVLDVGCGLGGTCNWLAERIGCRVTGVTISEVQAQMALRLVAARSPAPTPRFVIGDAAHLPVRGCFNVVLALEVLSHVTDRAAFFGDVARILAPEGRIGIAAWLKKDRLSAAAERRHVVPIETGMLVRLPTRSEYEELLERQGLTLSFYRDISAEVAPTWDVCLEIVKNRALWRVAWERGPDVVEFLRSFQAMRRGFAAGAFRYAVFVGKRPAD